MNQFSFKVIFYLFMNLYFIDCRSMEVIIKYYQIKRNDFGQWYVVERYFFELIFDLIWYYQYNVVGKLGILGWESWRVRFQIGNVFLVLDI